MDDNIEISRDKKNPTWAWVWDVDKPLVFTDDYKRIIIDVCGSEAVCVYYLDEENYMAGKRYSTVIFDNYEIIKEPTYRPFETIKEYIEATKDRKDFRAIRKDGQTITSLIDADSRSDEKQIWFRGSSSRYIYADYVWLDDRSPVGVKCS